jgi:uncharacterized protein (TIGR02646 family)
MIYIHLDETKIDKKWLERTEKALAKIEQMDDPMKRSKFINKCSDLWRAVRDSLLAMSHGKCWYSEAPDAVSDWHVDHFRPKSLYQWLAFDWRNFRISGAIPNRSKSDEFPLADQSPRASWEDRDYSEEHCLLLDPTNPIDADLMTFDEKGLPIPWNSDSPVIRERVEATTKVLGLDSDRLKDQRQKRWRECKAWIDELRELLPMDQHMDLPRRRQIERIMNILRQMTFPDQSYSAVARACLRAAGYENLIARAEHARAA